MKSQGIVAVVVVAISVKFPEKVVKSLNSIYNAQYLDLIRMVAYKHI